MDASWPSARPKSVQMDAGIIEAGKACFSSSLRIALYETLNNTAPMLRTIHAATGESWRLVSAISLRLNPTRISISALRSKNSAKAENTIVTSWADKVIIVFSESPLPILRLSCMASPPIKAQIDKPNIEIVNMKRSRACDISSCFMASIIIEIRP